jgi:hypothetical protein
LTKKKASILIFLCVFKGEKNPQAIKSLLGKSQKQRLTRIKTSKLRPKRSMPLENTPPSSKSSYASSSTSSSPTTTHNSNNSSSTRLIDILYRNFNSAKNKKERKKQQQQQQQNESDKPVNFSSSHRVNSSAAVENDSQHLKVSNLNMKLIKSMTQRSQQLDTRSKENKQRTRSTEAGTTSVVVVSTCQSSLLASPPLSLSLSSSSLASKAARSVCSPAHSNISSATRSSAATSPNSSSSSSTSIKLSLRFHNNNSGQRVGIVVNNHSKSKRI